MRQLFAQTECSDEETTFTGASPSVREFLHGRLPCVPLQRKQHESSRSRINVSQRRIHYHKVFSNVRGLLSSLNQSDKSTPCKVKALAAVGESSHVLVLKLNYQFGTLVVRCGTSSDRNRKVTQRIVLSLVSAVYDPIGLVAPYTVKALLLL